MEPSPTLMAKKISNIIRVAFFMIQKGVSKSKFVLDLHLLMKRGKIIGKALNDLMLEHQTALRLSCRSHDMHISFVSPATAAGCRPHDMHMSFVSPREYEFSCSNSPSNRPYNRFHANRRRTHSHHHKHNHAPAYIWDDAKSSEGGDFSEGSNNLMGGIWKEPAVETGDDKKMRQRRVV
ncbi:hypothetical protein GH714_031276 [Hevea brasiliensis]|uniref:Uncharacterized protein n=1 Tax=Hevea brasiliensis TaxID=3981 RepID=A0A6A6LNA8_HEVBR|nr:hypothetical protein GH714_031276 [Hevea brasiliensis]